MPGKNHAFQQTKPMRCPRKTIARLGNSRAAKKTKNKYTELGVLAEGAQAVLAGKDTTTLEQLALTGGSPHGARPKGLVQYDTATGQVSTDRAAACAAWLVKFQAQGEAKEVCAIEMLYATMARKSDLDMPVTKYFDLSPKLAGFGIERFDRQRGMRVPMLSLAGLLR